MRDENAPPSLARWLWRDYLRNHRAVILFALVLMAIEGAMLGLLSWIIRPMFDQVFVAKDRDAIVWVGLAVFAIFCARAMAGFGHRVLMMGVGQRVSAALQRDMLGHMLRLDSAFFQDNAPGVLIERLRGDSLAASTVWSVVFSAIGRDVVALLSLFAVALSIDWLWTLIAVAAVPVLMGPMVILQKWVRQSTREARNVAAGLATRLDETFHGIDTIKLNTIEAREADRYAGALDEFVSAQVKSEAGQAGIPALMDIIAGIGFFGVLTYGGLQIIDGAKTVGEFMSFFTAMALIFEPLRRIGNVSGAWAAAQASLERLRAVFDAKPSIISPTDATALAMAPGSADVVFEDVAFSYGDQPVLRNTSFVAKAGETTAFVGASGAGKSTLFRLLTRLADPQKGAVRIGDTSVAQLDLVALRQLFAVVTQDAQLFDETLRDNILFGGASDQLQPVLEASHVAEFLSKLAHGPDTRVGPRGSGLSGGQRQRVAIARALSRDAPILLLDEATSALDAQSETMVQSALDRLSEGRTTLVIAHRLATVRAADKIVVMDQGRVVEQGTHDVLIAQNGHYAQLYRLQFDE